MTPYEMRAEEIMDDACTGYLTVIPASVFSKGCKLIAEALASVEQSASLPGVNVASLTNSEQQQLAIMVAAQALRSLPATVRRDALSAMGYAEQSASRRLEARALELWAMDVLDAWAASGPPPKHHTLSKATPGMHAPYCVTIEPRWQNPSKFAGQTAKEARLKAGRALKAAHPELPDEPKGSE
jgi:hypothetical protein